MIRKLRESQQECDSIVKHVIEALFSKRIIKLVKTTVKYLSNVEFDRTNAEENEITRCFKFYCYKNSKRFGFFNEPDPASRAHIQYSRDVRNLRDGIQLRNSRMPLSILDL